MARAGADGDDEMDVGRTGTLAGEKKLPWGGGGGVEASRGTGKGVPRRGRGRERGVDWTAGRVEGGWGASPGFLEARGQLHPKEGRHTLAVGGGRRENGSCPPEDTPVDRKTHPIAQRSGERVDKDHGQLSHPIRVQQTTGPSTLEGIQHSSCVSPGRGPSVKGL